MRLLVTGASGFVGRRLVAAARARWPQGEVVALAGPGEADGVDVADAQAVEAAMAKARPTHLVHLAAVAAVTDAARDSRAAFAVNLGGALNVVEALRREAPEAVLLHVSSGEVYGRTLREAHGRPVDEGALLKPANAYAASKAAADLLVQAAAEQGLRAIVARPFNHIGAGQSTAFAIPAFAAQIARAEAGLQPAVVEVGSLEDARDFLAVDDIVDAYLRLLEHGAEPGCARVFNVASGEPVAIAEMLARLLRLSELTFEVRVDPARLRRERPAAHAGDAGRLRGETSWRPRHTLDTALHEALDDQRARVGLG